MTRSGLLSRIGLLALSVVITLAISELILGLIWPRANALDLCGLLESDEVLGTRLAANSSKAIRGILNDYRTEIAINSHGFRSPEYSPESEPGLLRIALMGDSEVFGVGVEENEMLNAVMEERLREAGFADCQVLNFAIPGTGTVLHSKLLEHTVLDWDVDAVIFLVTVANDLSDNLRFAGRGESAETDGPAPRVNPIWRRIRQLNLYKLARFKVLPHLPGLLVPRASALGESPNSVAVWYANDDLKDDFALMADALLASREACASRGVKMYVSPIPSRAQSVPSVRRILRNTLDPNLLAVIDSDPERPQRMLREFSREHDISYIEVLDEFTELAEAGVRVRYPNDGHLNPRGTSELARILVSALKDDLPEIR